MPLRPLPLLLCPALKLSAPYRPPPLHLCPEAGALQHLRPALGQRAVQRLRTGPPGAGGRSGGGGARGAEVSSQTAIVSPFQSLYSHWPWLEWGLGWRGLHMAHEGLLFCWAAAGWQYMRPCRLVCRAEAEAAFLKVCELERECWGQPGPGLSVALQLLAGTPRIYCQMPQLD